MKREEDMRKEKGLSKRDLALYKTLSEKAISKEIPEVMKIFVDLERLRELLLPIKEKYKLTFGELIQLVEEGLFFPDSILNNRLTVLEAVVKYLKENIGLSLHKTADALARDERNIWHIYNSAKSKYPERFVVKEVKLWVPISIFSKTRLSALETIVEYLKELGPSYHEISVLLKRDDRTIWTVYQRARKKNVI